MRGISGMLALAALLSCAAMAQSGGDASVPGREVLKAGPNLYYFYGRGVFRVPPGWVLLKTVEGNRLVFEKTVSGPYPENCVVSPSVYSNTGGGDSGNGIANYLIQDEIDDFNKKAANAAQKSSRRWTTPYRGMVAARFFGWARLPRLFQRRDGTVAGGYVSTSVIEIARAHVAINVRCNGFYLTVHDDTGADMLNAIDVDPARPYILNLK